jgi:hypothetical protein
MFGSARPMVHITDEELKNDKTKKMVHTAKVMAIACGSIVLSFVIC